MLGTTPTSPTGDPPVTPPVGPTITPHTPPPAGAAPVQQTATQAVAKRADKRARDGGTNSFGADFVDHEGGLTSTAQNRAQGRVLALGANNSTKPTLRATAPGWHEHVPCELLLDVDTAQREAAPDAATFAVATDSDDPSGTTNDDTGVTTAHVATARAKTWRAEAAQLRTDTASTVMTTHRGTAAGHTGAGVHRGIAGMSDAHDLEIHAQLRGLTASEDKLPQTALPVYMAAVAVASLAPAAAIREKYPQGRLNSSEANADYEGLRNSMKDRLQQGMNHLSEDHQHLVHNFIKDTMGPALKLGGRHIAPGRASSPLRDRGEATTGPRGGGYLPVADALTRAPTRTLHPTPAEGVTLASYVTAPLRGRAAE